MLDTAAMAFNLSQPLGSAQHTVVGGETKVSERIPDCNHGRERDCMYLPILKTHVDQFIVIFSSCACGVIEARPHSQTGILSSNLSATKISFCFSSHLKCHVGK